ncbi:MAG: ATP-binding protein [Firmicutes bacterium]|nr:ATP-binding protein [Bacillota bacterium]
MDPMRARAFPAKSFFVNMLTRDIELLDAVLDLLDNCVDGVIRHLDQKDLTEVEKPYSGHWADIDISPERFAITDNCGGIPLDVARRYAFAVGKPPESDAHRPTIGAYGIGMKRAMFKMGRHAMVETRTTSEAFRVEIAPDWLENDNDWDLPITLDDSIALSAPGTRITVEQLHPAIAKQFEPDGPFITTLKNSIATHFGYIIDKGFAVRVNSTEVHAAVTHLLFDSSGIQPYVYKGAIEDVEVYIAVGFYRPLPSDDEEEDEWTIRRSADEAGWTIVCNDRVVVYKDRTILTGWGEANVPNYHNQFIGISGVAEFRSNDPLKLPMKTTKRGIDAGSSVYLKAKNHMREGLKLFTDYTNKWKQNREEVRRREGQAQPLPVRDSRFQMLLHHNENAHRINHADEQSIYYKPNLPLPEPNATRRQIRFYANLDDIEYIRDEGMGQPDATPSAVGEYCFQRELERLRKA